MPLDDDIQYVDHNRLRWTTGPDSLLGQGSFGCVYRGTYDSATVAIKVIKPPAHHEGKSPEEYRVAESSARKQHLREIHRFRVVQNPNIIQCFDVFRDVNPRDLFIVTEYLEGGSLYDSLTRMRARQAVLEDRSFLHIAKDMALGLNHVHSQQYTHGDMKPQNVLLTTAFEFDEAPSGVVASLPPSAKVKIADFGLSKRLEGAEQARGLLVSTAATADFGTGPCGTYLYMSPEAYEGVSQLEDSEAKAADVYAYGLILFELLSGLQSWSLENVRNPMKLQLLVRKGERPQWGERKEHISADYINLVEQCWSQNVSDRPTVKSVLNTLSQLEKKSVEKTADTYVSDISQTAAPRVNGSSGKSDRSPMSDVLGSSASHHSNTECSPHPEHVEDLGLDHSEGDDPGSSTEDRHRGAITQVDSMRRLTKSQQEQYAGSIPLLGQDLREGDQKAWQGALAQSGTDSDGFKDVKREQQPNGNSMPHEGPVVEPKPNAESDVPEIDQSVVGGQAVVRVQSVNIDPPALPSLSINIGDNDKRKAIFGVGSIADKSSINSGEKRPDSDILDSFHKAAGFDRGDKAVTDPAIEKVEELGRKPPSTGPDNPILRKTERISESPYGADGRNIVTVAKEAVTDIVRKESSGPEKTESTDDNCVLHGQPPVQRAARSYHTPDDFDEEEFSRIVENDPSFLPMPNGLSPSPNRSQNEVSTPIADRIRYRPQTEPRNPLNVHLGLTGWHNRRPYPLDPVQPPNGLNSPVLLDSVDEHAVLLALKAPDAWPRIHGMWKQGHMRTIAFGLASFPDLAGTEMLQIACRLLHYCIQLPNFNKDPDIARDLCMAIGNIARNDSVAVDRDAVLKTLRVVLSTMYGLSSSFQQSHHGSVQVFVSCNFAMCNLFKVCNVIDDPGLRTQLAEWITHSISWNVFHDGHIRGPHLETLAYTSTSAARNFMWMNEDNVIAFTRGNSGRVASAPSATNRVISSMLSFDRGQGSFVLEASLSALAMIVHFPQQRTAFIRSKIVGILMDVLHRHVQEVAMASLIFSMITVLLSGPMKDQEEIEVLRKEFDADGCCYGLTSALDQICGHNPGNVDKIEVLEKGCIALLTTMLSCEPSRPEVTEKGIATVLRLTEWLVGIGPLSQYEEGKEAMEKPGAGLARALCELVCELGQGRSTVYLFKERRMSVHLDTMLSVFGNNGGFASVCHRAITILS